MGHKRLIISIESAEKYEKRQALCRRGWLRAFASKHPDVEAFFVVGGGLGGASCNGDVVSVAASDAYEGLPQKTRRLFEYVLDKYEFDFLYKCDDDTFVHVDRLVAHLNQDDYVGRVNTWQRDRKSIYAEGGAGYILSKCAVKLAVENFLYPEGINGAEDVCVALALRTIGILPVNDDRLSQQPTPSPSKSNDQISCHYIRDQAQVDEILAGL